MQAQIQALSGVAEAVAVEIPRHNIRSNVEVAKPQTFNRKVSKVLGFLIVCKIYIRMRIRETAVEKQIQQVLLYAMIGKFLMDLKKKFGREDNEMIKVVELKKMKQENRMMEKFVQEFRRAARRSRYKRRLLVEEFKRRINEVIRRKLMETESLLGA